MTQQTRGPPLPHGWDVLIEETNGLPVYVNHNNLTTTRDDPRLRKNDQEEKAPPPQDLNEYTYIGEIPDGEIGDASSNWDMLLENASGEIIYVDHIKRTTTWDDPRQPSTVGRHNMTLNEDQFVPRDHKSQSLKDKARVTGRQQHQGDREQASGSRIAQLSQSLPSAKPPTIPGHKPIAPTNQTGATQPGSTQPVLTKPVLTKPGSKHLSRQESRGAQERPSGPWRDQPWLSNSLSTSPIIMGQQPIAQTTQPTTTLHSRGAQERPSGSWLDQPWLSKPLPASPIILGHQRIAPTTQSGSRHQRQRHREQPSATWINPSSLRYPSSKSPIITGEPPSALTTQTAPSVGSCKTLEEYVRREWYSATPDALKIQAAYHYIQTGHNLSWLRVIRSDYYCAVRSVIYQALLQNIPIIGLMHDSVLQKLDIFRAQSDAYNYLQGWSFANRLQNDANSIYVKAVTCIDRFFNLLKETYHKGSDLEMEEDLYNYFNELEVADVHLKEEIKRSYLKGSDLEREEFLTEYLNESDTADTHIMEAVKILMMLAALKLHHLYTMDHQSVPAFVRSLYTRDDSLTPAAFFTNHLNRVGKSSGLEQVEMHLLAYTLGIMIRVFRPSQFNNEGFIVNYKGVETEELPRVDIVTDDDRHYNVLLM